jgi:hypothetical protein
LSRKKLKIKNILPEVIKTSYNFLLFIQNLLKIGFNKEIDDIAIKKGVS